jgi:hypothetical protein
LLGRCRHCRTAVGGAVASSAYGYAMAIQRMATRRSSIGAEAFDG